MSKLSCNVSAMIPQTGRLIYVHLSLVVGVFALACGAAEEPTVLPIPRVKVFEVGDEAFGQVRALSGERLRLWTTRPAEVSVVDHKDDDHVAGHSCAPPRAPPSFLAVVPGNAAFMSYSRPRAFRSLGVAVARPCVPNVVRSSRALSQGVGRPIAGHPITVSHRKDYDSELNIAASRLLPDSSLSANHIAERSRES